MPSFRRICLHALAVLVVPFVCAWAPPPSYEVELQGPPFGVVSTRDGAWVFVSPSAARNGVPMGISVLGRRGDRYEVIRTVSTPVPVNEMALTHDGKWMVASGGKDIVFLEVESLEQEGRPRIGTIHEEAELGRVYVAVSPDDRTLLVSNENKSSISVIDMEKVRAKGPDKEAILGNIPVGNAPVALVFSTDGKWVYSTSEVAARSWNWTPKVVPEGLLHSGKAGDHPRLIPYGALCVIDVEKARSDPAHCVVSRVPAGASPVRLSLSKRGDRIYATARGSDALLEFDVAKLVSDPDHSLLASVPVGVSPVPIALVDSDRVLVVGNSDRFNRNEDARSNLTVVETSRVGEGKQAILGTIPRVFCFEGHLEEMTRRQAPGRE